MSFNFKIQDSKDVVILFKMEIKSANSDLKVSSTIRGQRKQNWFKTVQHSSNFLQQSINSGSRGDLLVDFWERNVVPFFFDIGFQLLKSPRTSLLIFFYFIS